MIGLAWLVACARDPGSAGWVAVDVPNLVLAQRLVPAAALGPASAVCTAEGDPTERHHVTTDRVESGGLALFGLLADTAYACEISASSRTSTLDFRTAPLPDDLPAWEVTGVGGWGDYTIFNHGVDKSEPKILIVDREGSLRWYLEISFEASDLDVSYLGDGRVLYGGGYAAPPSIVDLAGALQLRAAEDDVYHHHVEQLASGEFVVLTLAPNAVGEVSWTGMEVEILDPQLSATTWSWNTQRGADEGWLPVPEQASDPYHLNAVQVTDDAVYINSRHEDLIAKLDRATGDLVWALGPSRDFSLRDANGEPDDRANWFYGAHAPEIAGDRILLYDNGYPRPGGAWSRVAEFAIDEVARTAQVVWEYTEPNWFEPIWGDADRLPDGHVLYTRAHCGNCLPNATTPTQIVEVDPENQEVVWRLQMSDLHDDGYRAERIDGCALFGNSRYCPELSSGDTL